MSDANNPARQSAPQRLSKAARRQQLLDLACTIIREQGTDALTLITLAQRAGVTKPVTYKHFTNRQALLYALYREFDDHLVREMDARIRRHASSFRQAAEVFADAYLHCVCDNGRVYEAIISALKAYPEYQDIRSRMRDYFCQIMQRTLGDFLSPDQPSPGYARLVAIFGAVEALSELLLEQQISHRQAVDETLFVIESLFLAA